MQQFSLAPLLHAGRDCALRFVYGGLLILALVTLSGIAQVLVGKFN